MVQRSELRLPAGEVASWDQLRHALRVRRLAEAAAVGLVVKKPAVGSLEDDVDGQLRAAYSEQVQPWIKSAVNDADVDRRRGEDLLFASAKEQAQAAKTLTDAESAGKSNYQAVGDSAAPRPVGDRNTQPGARGPALVDAMDVLLPCPFDND